MQLSKNRNRAPSQSCPACKHKAYVTSTRVISDIHTERYYLCSNAECKHQFKTLTEITATIVPPLTSAEKQAQDKIVLFDPNTNE